MNVAPTIVREWLANRHTNIRHEISGLALQVQQSLQRDLNAGDLNVFSGRRGDLLKLRRDITAPHFERSDHQPAAAIRRSLKPGQRHD